jgi:L,D-peptidoglycan transpeptidase YkuD (ErfK/YbiS/YcfS/YnhG family)
VSSVRAHLHLPLFVGLALGACSPAARASSPAVDGAAPLQAVLVTTASWDATDGVLRRYARPLADAPWEPVGEPARVSVGRTGLAWGTGLHPQVPEGPQKREGDGKAPAGIFVLSSAFGYASAEEAGWVRLPYHESTPSVKCVDDGGSAVYNQRVDADTLASAPDWSSHEEMRRRDDLYRWGIWVDHNTGPAVPGRGSCIFLHLWAAPGVPTAGCTSMAEADLRGLLAWLDPAASPVLVQLPDGEHARLRDAWRLP